MRIFDRAREPDDVIHKLQKNAAMPALRPVQAGAAAVGRINAHSRSCNFSGARGEPLRVAFNAMQINERVRPRLARPESIAQPGAVTGVVFKDLGSHATCPSWADSSLAGSGQTLTINAVGIAFLSISAARDSVSLSSSRPARSLGRVPCSKSRICIFRD